MTRGVYIHIPFCKNICHYCDFCKVYYHDIWVKSYLKALHNEVIDRYLGESIASIYIGGGTPSILQKEELEELFVITNDLHKNDSIEFTFECNLNDIQESLLETLKTHGVNRLSIGIESFNNESLKFLGRHHTFVEAKEKMDLIRSYGFKNVNIDLMYAIPGESLKDLKKDLSLFLKLNPDHISTYSLMIENHTVLSNQHTKSIDEDLDAMMYQLICHTLKKKKYIHYEVSNFSKAGKESKHNRLYWDNLEYYGFGLSSSGYIDQIRYTNTKNLFSYLKGSYNGTEEILSKQSMMNNEVMLGLRQLRGINIEDFKKKYCLDITSVYPVKPLLKNKELKLKGSYLSIPEDKIYVMNEILLKML